MQKKVSDQKNNHSSNQNNHNLSQQNVQFWKQVDKAISEANVMQKAFDGFDRRNRR